MDRTLPRTQLARTGRLTFGWAAAVLALVTGAVESEGAPKTNAPARIILEEAALPREIKASTSFAPVVKKVAPSVVNIYSTMTVRDRGNPWLSDPLLRRFFEPRGEQRKTQGLGSGVIITADGYILTANHVVEGADSVKVALAAGQEELTAKVVGTDPPTDIAVLKIDTANKLPAVAITDSDKLEVGDMVLAVGNPFGVGQTVTMGIISALGRGFGINAYEDFIQTDAAINPGNSGGALVDAQGRLVGINTAIFSRSGGNMGVGFAVPINLARYVMDRLISDGKVTRGYLGLSLQPDLSPGLVKQFKLPDMNGALVTSVEPGSPAAKAAFKEGDFVVEFNGKKVADMRQLRLMVSQTAPGTRVNLKVIRDGEDKSLSATLASLPEEFTGRDGQSRPGQGSSNNDGLDGVEFTDLDGTSRREAGIPSTVTGALVTNVDSDSNSAEAGLRVGDVVIEINRQKVHTAEEAVALSEKAKSERILLRIWRSGEGRGGTYYLSVDNTKRK